MKGEREGGGRGGVVGQSHISHPPRRGSLGPGRHQRTDHSNPDSEASLPHHRHTSQASKFQASPHIHPYRSAPNASPDRSPRRTGKRFR